LEPIDLPLHLLDLSHLWIDTVVFVLGFSLVCLLAQVPAVPLAPGYEQLRDPRRPRHH
jgi:hypothetical protein